MSLIDLCTRSSHEARECGVGTRGESASQCHDFRFQRNRLCNGPFEGNCIFRIYQPRCQQRDGMPHSGVFRIEE
jgi:hypothetical protein